MSSQCSEKEKTGLSSPFSLAQRRHLSSPRIPVVLRIQVSIGKILQFGTDMFYDNDNGIENLGVTSQTSFDLLVGKFYKLLGRDDKIGNDKWNHNTGMHTKNYALGK